MNTDINSVIASSLLFGNPGVSGIAAGQRVTFPDASGEMGESSFQKLISLFMTEQATQKAAIDTTEMQSETEQITSLQPEAILQIISKQPKAGQITSLHPETMQITSKQSGETQTISLQPEAMQEADIKFTDIRDTVLQSAGIKISVIQSENVKSAGIHPTASAKQVEGNNDETGEIKEPDESGGLLPQLLYANNSLVYRLNSVEFSPEGITDYSDGNKVFTVQKSETRGTGEEQATKEIAGIGEKAFDHVHSVTETLIPLLNTSQTNETAEMAPAAKSIEKAEPYSQIGNKILAKLEQKGPQEFKMQLQPENLGEINIKLKINEGKLTIDILAANQETQALLKGQVDKLIASMGLQNVQVESIKVSQHINSQIQDYSQGQEHMNAAMDLSQRNQQQQYHRRFLNDIRLNGSSDRFQTEISDYDTAERTGAYRYEPHRINYRI